jgi:hypothetical protein
MGKQVAEKQRGPAMTLDRYKGKIVFECDRCHEVNETQHCELREAIEEIKSEGWIARKHIDDWRHYCARCK